MEQQPADPDLHKFTKIYLKISNNSDNRHPREGGGDAHHRAAMKVNFETGSNHYMYK